MRRRDIVLACAWMCHTGQQGCGRGEPLLLDEGHAQNEKLDVNLPAFRNFVFSVFAFKNFKTVLLLLFLLNILQALF